MISYKKKKRLSAAKHVTGNERKSEMSLDSAFEEYITGFAKNYSRTSAQSPSIYFYCFCGPIKRAVYCQS